MRNSDFDLVDDLFCKVVDKKEQHGWHSLNAEERVLLLVWHASGIIGNGGFLYFFEQEIDADATARAYEKIGCHECAELLRLSLSLFPDSVLQASLEERVKYLEDNKEMFDKLSSGFWKADKEMRVRLAEYVKGHIGKICGHHVPEQ